MRIFGFALAALALSTTTACPRASSTQPRPSAEVEDIERTHGDLLVAHISLSSAANLTVEAVDWELLSDDEILLRGRSSGLHVVIAYPGAIALQLGRAVEVELRGAVHLRHKRSLSMVSFSQILPAP